MSDTAVREEVKRRIKYCLLECFRFLSLMYAQNLTENPRKFPVHRGTTILKAEMKCTVCTWGRLKCALVLNSWLQGWGVPQPLPSAATPKDAWGLLLLCWVLFCLDIEKRKWLLLDLTFRSNLVIIGQLYPDAFIPFQWLRNIRKGFWRRFQKNSRIWKDSSWEKTHREVKNTTEILSNQHQACLDLV